MAADSIFEPEIEVKAADQIKAGRLVSFTSGDNKDEYAFTALQNAVRFLLLLNRPKHDGTLFPPFVQLQSDVARAGKVLPLFAHWRIEPVKVLTDHGGQLPPGVILVSESIAGCMVANLKLDSNGRDAQVAVRLDTGAVLDPEAFQELKAKGAYVAVTEWNLWVPQFSDGKLPAWKLIFDFPTGEQAVNS